MKLSEALNQLKNLKAEAKRVDGYVTESVVHYEDVEPDYNYVKELERRRDIQSEIDDLKANIQVTNAQTRVLTESGKAESLAKLILLNSSLRADLAFYQKLLDTKLESDVRSYLRDTRSKDDIRKVYAEGYSKDAIREYIHELEGRKQRLDSLISSTNLTTELVEV